MYKRIASFTFIIALTTYLLFLWRTSSFKGSFLFHAQDQAKTKPGSPMQKAQPAASVSPQAEFHHQAPSDTTRDTDPQRCHTTWRLSQRNLVSSLGIPGN